jgi:hypothetical protein
MTRALAVVAVAAALVAAGCGGGNSKKAAITDYVDRVNAVEQQLAKPFAAVTKANQSFARAKTRDPQLEKQLAKSERTMRTLSRRLAAIEAPTEVTHLRALLLELVNRQLTLTREVHQLYEFVPAFQADLKPLAAANATLSNELHKTATTGAATTALDAEKAAALETYAGILDGVIVKLRRLDPPPVWQPGYTVQLTSLDHLRSTARALADAIRANRAAALPPLLERFDRAAVAGRSTPAQKAQRAAVLAYNGRISSLVKLTRRIGAEQVRLQKAYG